MYIPRPKTFHPKQVFQHFRMCPEHSTNTESKVTPKYLQTVPYTKVLLNCENLYPAAKKKKMVKANTAKELLYFSVFNSLPVISPMLRPGDSQEPWNNWFNFLDYPWVSSICPLCTRSIPPHQPTSVTSTSTSYDWKLAFIMDIHIIYILKL